MSATLPVKGDRFVAYPDDRPWRRVFITVNRVAKDGTWADVSCQTWAVRWTKRQPLPLSFAVERAWGRADPGRAGSRPYGDAARKQEC